MPSEAIGIKAKYVLCLNASFHIISAANKRLRWSTVFAMMAVTSEHVDSVLQGSYFQRFPAWELFIVICGFSPIVFVLYIPGYRYTLKSILKSIIVYNCWRFFQLQYFHSHCTFTYTFVATYEGSFGLWGVHC